MACRRAGMGIQLACRNITVLLSLVILWKADTSETGSELGQHACHSPDLRVSSAASASAVALASFRAVS